MSWTRIKPVHVIKNYMTPSVARMILTQAAAGDEGPARLVLHELIYDLLEHIDTRPWDPCDFVAGDESAELYTLTTESFHTKIPWTYPCSTVLVSAGDVVKLDPRDIRDLLILTPASGMLVFGHTGMR